MNKVPRLPRSLSVAVIVISVLSLIASRCAFAQRPGVVPNGSTQTAVSTVGAVTNVTTNTIRGGNAYNSFSTFNVNQGNTVNLFLPNGTDNLLNLVNSQTSSIDGILNSIKNGKIGGNLFFADPYGFIIGTKGAVNAGSFLAVTPTTAFMNQFFTMPGVPSANATASLLSGTVPITPDGLISVQGKINAAGSIGLFGGKIANSGTIASGAVFTGTKPDFSDVVNTVGLQSGAAISVQNGSIEIHAAGDFENSGTISTNGGNNLNAGNIDIHAGGNIKLDPNSLVSASGQGKNSNGGRVKIFADKNSELDANAVVAAEAGSSGNGGSVDFSAKGAVALKGGALNAGALNGTPGTVTVDPDTIEISGTQAANDGTNVTLDANQAITVDPNATVTSQVLNGQGQSTANSGNISLTAPQITVGNGAQILANANNGHLPGDITFTASQTGTGGQASATTGITIGSATILGGNITFQSTAQATADRASSPIAATLLNDTSLGSKLGLAGAAVSAKTSSSTSTIDLEGTHVTSTGNLTINSTATSSTTSDLTAASTSVTGTPVNATFAYGQSNSTATTTIGSGTVLTSAGAVNISATSNNTLDVSAKTNQSQQGVFAGAYGSATSNSTAEIDGSVTGNSVHIGAANQNSFSTSSSASDYNATAGNGGGMSLAIGDYHSTAATTLQGSATSNAGDVQVTSSSTNTDNATRSASSETSQGVKNDIFNFEGKLQNLGGVLGSPLSSSTPSPSPDAGSMQLGLGAAVSVAQTSNTATTTVSGTLNAQGGNAQITSAATDNPQISANGSISAGTTNFGGAVAVSDFHNTSDTYVNGSATVTGGTGVSISADAEITDPAVARSHLFASDFTSLQGFNFSNSVTNAQGTGWGNAAENDVKGIVHGITNAIEDIANPGEFTTSFVNNGSSNQKGTTGGTGVGGAVNLLGLTNQSVASVTGSANVTASSGDLSVISTASMTAINVAGMGLGFGQLVSLNPGVSAGSSLGGSYNGTNLTNTSTAYIGDGTTATAHSGDVDVHAKNDTFLIGVAQAGDQAQQFGITGTFNQSTLTDNAAAYIQSNANVTAAGDVNVTATNPVTDIAIGGALGVGGQLQIGIGVNWNTLNDTTLAYIGDPANGATSSNGQVSGRNVNVTASSNEDLYAITFAATWPGNAPPSKETTGEKAAAGAAGGSGPTQEASNGAGGEVYGFGISGEIALNQVSNGSHPGLTTQAFINNGANVTATNGNIGLTAGDTSFAVAAGLAISLAQEGALSGAYSQNTFNKDVEAFTGNTTLNASGLNLQATSNGSLFNVTAGGSINTTDPSVAVAGAVNNNSITNTVNADLGTGTNASSIGSNGITVNASEGSGGDQVVSVAGGFAIAVNGGGFGAGIDMGNYTNNVSASIGGSQINTSGNVQVTSDTNVSYLPIAVQFAGGTVFGLGGAVASEQITDNTASTVGKLTTSNNLLVGSNDSSSATIIAGGLGVGGDVGFSVSAIIPQFIRTTESQISNGASVTANGNGSPISYHNQSFTGTALDATNSGSLDDYAVAGGVSASFGAAGAVIVNPFWQNNSNSLQSTTEANVGSNAIVHGQSLSLLATDTSGIQDVAGMLAIGGDVGAGVGFDQMVPVWTVQTSIGNGANVTVGGNVVASSNLQNPISSYVVSGAGSGGVSAEAAVTVLNDTSHTNSYIDTGASVTSNNNVALSARRSTNLTVVDGGAAIGAGAGISASIGDVTDNNTVQAYVGTNASVTALAQGSGLSALVDSSGTPVTGTVDGLSVTAQGTDTLTAVATGVAGSAFVSGAGSALTNSFTEDTSAKIYGGATVNGTNGGAGTSQGVNLVAADTTTLKAGAGAAALSVDIVGIGAGLGFDQENIQKNTTAGIDSGANVNALGAVNVDALSGETIHSYTGAIAVAANGALAGTSADYHSNPITPVTDAYISGATVNTGSLGVNANENLHFTAVTGEVSGASDVALGAATALATADANTSAAVSGDITAGSNGVISVGSNYTSDLNATALSGSGGTFSGNAVYAQLADNSTNSASLSGMVPQAGTVNVDATTNRGVHAIGGSLAVSGLGAGAVIALTSTSGSTTASVSGSIGQTTGENVQSLGAAATDSSNTSSTSNSLAAGIGNGQFNQSSATVGGTVQASLADASAIKVTGSLGLNASADDGASASNNGLNIGGVSVGESQSSATVNPTVRATVGQNANVAAGQNISIDAAYNYNPASDTALTADTVAADSSSSVGALVGVTGATSSASSRPTVQASFGTGSTVSAGNNMIVQSLSSNTISSDANGNAFAVAGSQGNTTSTSTITNNNTIATASGVTLAAGNNLTLTAKSTNHITNASAEGTQTGVIGAGNNTTTATASLNDTTSATVGTSNQLNAGLSGTALIQALANNQAYSNATDLAANAFGGTNTATANTNVTTNNTTEVSGNSTVQAGTVSLDAEVTNEQYSATATSKTYTLNSDATANSNLEVTSNVNANVDGGANLTGANAITIKADQENLLGNSSATGKVVGASGSPTANSDNNLNDNSNVNIASAATLTTDHLTIEAISPFDKGASYQQTASAVGDTSVVWVTETVKKVVDEVFGWIPYVKEVTEWVTETVQKILDSNPTARQTGNFNPSNTITMNGAIVQPGGINPVLVANNIGGNIVFTKDVNVNASVSGNTITVNDLTNQIQPTIAFNAPNGTVQGNFTVHRNTTWTGVSITNNTSDNLVINNINPLTSASAGNPDMSVSAANNTSSFTLVDTNTGTTGIVVQNNSGSDVTLAGVINNPGGSTTVNNTGGNILASGSELLKEANTTLDATAGSVGSSGNYINVQMTAEAAGGNTAPANLSVTAGQNVFLNAQLVQDVVNTAPASIVGPANINSVAAGGAVNLNLLQPQAIVYGISSDTPPVLTITPVNAAGVYNIGTITGANNVNINQTAGPMNLGTVTSTNGNVNLTAQSGDVDLGTVSSTHGTTTISASGSILDTNHTVASDINAVNLNLTATSGSIGTSADPLNIDSSYNRAAGQVTASANLGVYLNQVADNLNVGTITSTTSDAVLTSAGSITDTNSGTGSSINAANVNLTARGSIGGTTVGTLETDATGQLTATANQNANITQTTGPMNVNTVTATNGNVNLTASNGDVDLGTVNSIKGATAITANGSILDANHTALSDINANSLNLTATNGTVGLSTDLLNIYTSYSAPGVVNALAKNGIYLNEVTGPLNVNQIQSQTSDIVLTSQGSILNASTTATNPSGINLIGNNITLTSSIGSIGSASKALVVNNRNTTASINNLLNTTAYGDTYITEAQGNLVSNSIASANGNIGLTVSNGNGSLTQITGNQAISFLVNGSTLNIQSITGSTATSAKAASPNNVSLTVNQAGGALTVGSMSVFQSIFTRADNTNLNKVIVTNLANPQLDTDHQAQSLHFNNAGYNGGLANTINVNIVPCSACKTSPAVIFDNYLTKNGNVFASMDWLEFINAELTGSGQFQNAWENFIITGKSKTKIGPWYFFLIGDKFARNADQYDTVSPARYLQLPNHYTWYQSPTVVFPYLLNLYRFSSTTSTSNF